MLQDILKQVKDKNKRQTAKFMTLIEKNDPDAINHLKNFYLEKTSSQVIGVTGLPGSGKSTIINKLLKFYRTTKNLTVGIIAIDPTSSFTGGAFLGDRVRLKDFFLDKDVFIRSMASKGKLGGVAPATSMFTKILQVYGCDIIIIETTGTGQTEIDINLLVDTVVVVNIPGTGDLIQTLKAGILEIADIFVINKADHEGKDKIRLLLEQLIQIDNKNDLEWVPIIVETIATMKNVEEGGIINLATEIENHYKKIYKLNNSVLLKQSKIKNELISIFKERMFSKFNSLINSGEIDQLVTKIIENEIDPISAVELLLAKNLSPSSKGLK